MTVRAVEANRSHDAHFQVTDYDSQSHVGSRL